MDQQTSDWTGYFNERFGAGITRRNAVIYTPIVQNFTAPKRRYQDGTVAPPRVVQQYVERQPRETDYLSPGLHRTGDALEDVDSNPNFTDGSYFPDYARHTLYYLLPEFGSSEGSRLVAPGPAYKIPWEVRRNLLP